MGGSVIAPFVNLVITTPINFLVNKYWSFNESSKKNDLRYFLLFLNAILILAFVFRTYFTIHTTDEVFNIEQAFRTVQGNVYLVENWEFYQTGDSFLYPFLKIFYMITGSTEYQNYISHNPGIVHSGRL